MTTQNSSGGSASVDPAALADQVAALAERITQLEAEVASLHASRPVPEEDLVVIAAAVAAYLGYDARVKAVRFAQSNRWTTEGRGKVHNRTVLHVR